MPLPTPSVQIDWGASGTFTTDVPADAWAAALLLAVATYAATDPGEDVTARVLPGIAAERGRNQIKSLSPPLANDLQGALNNASGDYSPANTGSPLYPNVDVGRLARWRLASSTTTYDVVRGHLDQIAPNPDWGRQEVGFGALSQLARLVGKTGFSSALYGDCTVAHAIRADEAMHVVYDLAGIPMDQRAFDVCQTLLLVFVVRPTDELFDLALRIWASEGPGARLYDGADGVSYLTSRYAALTDARSTTVQATYRDGATEPYYVGWTPGAGEESVVNVCSVAWTRRAIDASSAVLWTFGATVVLSPGEARPVRVAPATDDPIASVVALAGGTDYTLAAGSLAGAVFDRTSGPFVTLTLTAGGSGATLTGLQVRGKLARVVASSQVVNTIDAAASIARYGPKPYTLPTLPDIDYLTLQDFCNAVVGQNQTPRPLRTIEVPLASDGLINATLAREPGDRVRVLNAREGFDREMFVEYVRVEWPQSGVPRAFLGCEATVDLDYGFWDQGLWDVNLWAY